MKQFLILLLFCPLLSWAQPLNDNPCGAIELTVNATCNFNVYSNVGATEAFSFPAPGCGGFAAGEEDVWFKITVPADGNLIIDSEAGTLNNIAMAVYTSTTGCSGLFSLALCDDGSSGGGMPRLTLTGQIPGTVIYLRVWDELYPLMDSRNQGSFSLCARSAGIVPFNDNPCQAQPIIPDTTCVYLFSDNTNALTTSNIPNPGCGGNNQGTEDVWFVVQIPSSGAINIQAIPGSLRNLVIAAYSAPSCNGPFSPVGCAEASALNAASPKLELADLVPGSYLFIRVWEAYYHFPGNLNPQTPRSQGSFGLCATIAPAVPLGGSASSPHNCNTSPPGGNRCNDATPMCTFEGYCGTTAGYDANSWSGDYGLDEAFCGSIENNSFFTFIAVDDTMSFDILVSNCNENDGIQIMVFDAYTSNVCNANKIETYGCEGQIEPGNGSFMATGLTAGDKYYLMVDGFAGDVCDYEISNSQGLLPGIYASADQTICLGESATMAVYWTGPGRISWTGPFLGSNDETTVVVTPLAVGTYQYIVVAPNLPGSCTGTNLSRDTVIITVIPPPEVTISTGDCFNGGLELNASGTGTYTYTWLPATNFETTSGASVLGVAGVQSTYIVIAADAAGCTASDTVTVTIPTVDSAEISPAYFCIAAPPAALTVNGTSGGLWSGIGITDPVNGIFDPTLAGYGAHAVVYSTSGGTCPASDTVLVRVRIPFADIRNDTFCISAPNSNIVFRGERGGVWSGIGIVDSVVGTFSPAVAGPGVHTVSYSTSGYCIASDAAFIVVDAEVFITAGILPSMARDTTINWGQFFNLSACNTQSTQATNYIWSFSGPGGATFTDALNCNTGVVTAEDGLYTFFIDARSTLGCSARDSVQVNIYFEPSNPQIPTAFSPGNDNINEVFQVVDLDRRWLKEFKIYNRWGQLIYDDLAGAWDGRYNGVLQPREVYMFVISWQFLNDLVPVVKRGTVTLMR
jgi:gliding motility-associated-like protein